MTEKGMNVINLIKKYKIYFDFTAKDLSQVSCEKIYPATLTSLVKEGILKKVGQNPCIYRYVDIDKNNDKELSYYIWEPLELQDDKIVQSDNFDIPIEIGSNGLMKFKTKQTILVGKNIDFFDNRISNDEDRYMLWNIMNFREDLKFLIYTFNKNYKEYLPDNWNDGYKNVEIKVLKTKEDMQVVSLDKVAEMTTNEKDILWKYCIDLLTTWKGNDIALNHSESFLVGYCYLLKGKEEDIKNALLNRYSEEEVDKFLVLGKDISKRGIPIYKELT